MALEKWKASSPQTKIASAAFALSVVLQIGYAVWMCFIFVYLKDQYRMSWLFFGGEEEMNVAGILQQFVLVVPELVVMAGLFFVKRWARGWAIAGGIVTLGLVVWSFVDAQDPMPTALLLAGVLDIAAATALLFAKKDFTERAGYAAGGAA